MWKSKCALMYYARQISFRCCCFFYMFRTWEIRAIFTSLPIYLCFNYILVMLEYRIYYQVTTHETDAKYLTKYTTWVWNLKKWNTEFLLQCLLKNCWLFCNSMLVFGIFVFFFWICCNQIAICYMYKNEYTSNRLDQEKMHLWDFQSQI